MENILELHNKTPVWNDGKDGERERERDQSLKKINITKENRVKVM